MTTLLELTGVSKSFAGVQALQNVSFDVRAGEVHALLGENGAGKSTLIKTIAGVHQPDSGELRFAGQPVRFNTPRDAQKLGINTIYQELSLYPELTVAENIFMGHALYRRVGPFSVMDWDTMFRRAKELLAELDVYNLDVRGKVGALSIGNRQRIEIAKALSLNAKLLIMDEPTAALGETDTLHLFRTTRLLRDRGVGIVYISHKLSEVFELADRVSVLRDGQYIGTQDVADTSERELISMMVGRDVGTLFPKQPSQVGEVVLELRHVSREPHTHDVSLILRAGEIVGLAGLVGSGRSETAQAIFGTLPAQSGEILVAGQPVTIRDPTQAVAHGVAYVPEDRGTQGLIKEMNVRENTSLAVLEQVARGGFISTGRERTLAREAIKKFGIRAYGPEQLVGTLSGGNQQKVVVGKWLASSPKVLIIDEPTRGVDVGAKAEIHRLIGQLAAEQGLAILMISSELPEILGMSDRVLVMREGRIVAEFSRDEATPEKVGGAMMSEQVGKQVAA